MKKVKLLRFKASDFLKVSAGECPINEYEGEITLGSIYCEDCEHHEFEEECDVGIFCNYDKDKK